MLASIAAATRSSRGASAHERPSRRRAIRAPGRRQTTATSALSASHIPSGSRATVSLLGRVSSWSWSSATAAGSRRAEDVISLPFISSGTSTAKCSNTVGAMSVVVTTPSVRVEAEVRLPPKPGPATPAGNSSWSARAPAANAISRSSGRSPSTIAGSSASRMRSTLSPGPQPLAQALLSAICTVPSRSTAISVARPLSASAVTGTPSPTRVEASRPGTMFAGASSARSTVRSQRRSGTWPSRR